MRPEWPLAFFSAQPGYKPLLPVLQQLAHFPDYADWATLPAPRTQTGLPIQFVEPDTLTHYYEVEIAQLGRVATRPANWHDAFNALVWHTFPRTKAALNALHLRHMSPAGAGERGPQRDAATLFDECGLIVVSCDPTLLAQQRDHQWHALFVAERDAWGTRIEAISLGHANYEALLTPFPGLTGKSWQVAVDADYFTLDAAARLTYLDTYLASQLDADWLQTPRQLPPLPYLGVPGWWPQQDEAFYADTAYFRPARHARRATG